MEHGRSYLKRLVKAALGTHQIFWINYQRWFVAQLFPKPNCHKLIVLALITCACILLINWPVLWCSLVIRLV